MTVVVDKSGAILYNSAASVTCEAFESIVKPPIEWYPCQFGGIEQNT